MAAARKMTQNTAIVAHVFHVQFFIRVLLYQFQLDFDFIAGLHDSDVDFQPNVNLARTCLLQAPTDIQLDRSHGHELHQFV